MSASGFPGVRTGASGTETQVPVGCTACQDGEDKVYWGRCSSSGTLGVQPRTSSPMRVVHHPRQVTLEGQRQRRQVRIIDLHPERKSRVKLNSGLVSVPGLGEQPPEILMQLPGQCADPITDRTAGIDQQAASQRLDAADAGSTAADPIWSSRRRVAARTAASAVREPGRGQCP